MYKPFDGDFDKSRIDDLSKFATDLLGNRFTDAEEIVLNFDPEIQEFRIAEWIGGEWTWDKYEPIPTGWTAKQVAELFQLGTIYFEPVGEVNHSPGPVGWMGNINPIGCEPDVP